MIYYILPPIIMVLSLTGLIFFLARKSQKIVLPEARDKRSGAEDEAEMAIDKETLKQKIGHYLLLSMEKIVKYFKIISLKTHNLFDALAKRIREKRSAEGEVSLRGPENRNDFLKNLKEEDNETKESAKGEKENDLVLGASGKVTMISAETARPEKKEDDDKREYERLLVDRIAVNPRDIEAYERLGDYYLEKGNLNDAKECFKQMLKLSPGSRKAKVSLRKVEGFFEK